MKEKRDDYESTGDDGELQAPDFAGKRVIFAKSPYFEEFELKKRTEKPVTAFILALQWYIPFGRSKTLRFCGGGFHFTGDFHTRGM